MAARPARPGPGTTWSNGNPSQADHETTPGLRADVVRAGPAATVVSLDGVVDIATAAVLASAVAGAVSAGGAGGRVVLELNRVTFLGACGLGVLLAAHADATRRGGTVVLVVDQVSPAAVALQFLPHEGGPIPYSTLTAALDDHDGDHRRAPTPRQTTAPPTPTEPTAGTTLITTTGT